MFGGFSDFFEKIGEGIKGILEFLISLPGKIADALKWLFDLLIDAVVSVASLIWDFFSDPIAILVRGIDLIVAFFQGIWDAFVNINKLMFIPSDEFINKKLSSISTSFNKKINVKQFEDAFEGLKGANARSIPQSRSVVMIFGAPVQGDFMQYITENLDVIHMVARAFVFLLLLKFNLNKIHKLIRGTDMFGGGVED